MRLLIGGSSTFLVHLKEFSDTLNSLGVESKLVFDGDYADGFPSRKIGNWFQTKKKFSKLIDEFKPDAIFVDRQRHFGINALKANIPLFVLLRGHYWSEIYWNKRTMYKPLHKRIALWQWDKLGKEILNGATAILPICKYLEKITNKFVPDKSTKVFFEGVDASRWYHVKGMNLKHPCVGLLQRASWWGKTSEMLILKKVLEKMPDVNFYWAGDGPYRNKIVPLLEKFDNFHWLGHLKYPDQVRQFFSEIDIYALVSGIDMSPHTLLEASLMKKPILATNVGGISESCKDGETCFLIKKGDSSDWINKISILLDDKEKMKEMGNEGYNYVKENFSWDKIANDFIKTIQSNFNL